MFNIQFGGSNSAQTDIAWFNIGNHKETLYVAPEQAEALAHFLNDVRHMPKDEFEDIMNALHIVGGGD